MSSKKWEEPSASERERLYILVEELNECIQIFNRTIHITMKVLRFGYDEVYPKERKTNRTRLEEEIGDVMGMVGLMIHQNDLSLRSIRRAEKAKLAKLVRYTRSQPIDILERLK